MNRLDGSPDTRRYAERTPCVSGGVDPRTNGEQRVAGTTRCRAGRQDATSRQASSRLLRCAPALRVTRRNVLTHRVFMAGSELPAISRPICETRRPRKSIPISCVRHLSAVSHSHQHRVAAADDVGESDHLHARIARRSVYEAHDPTGEPGAGNRHAGFGEQGLETRRWEPD